MQELSESRFKPVYEQSGLSHAYEKVTRVVLSSGKVSIDISDHFNKMEGDKDWLHIARIEQLYPFPAKDTKELFAKLPNLQEIVWVQEEPQNMGAWSYISPYLTEIAPKGVNVQYIGRRRRSSPAEGDPTVHKKNRNALYLIA
ncbi:hypothetical protein QNN00_15560 [Bacillus velezensis]|nr:hypothetical protein [Bacillus velezensis]